MPRITSHTLAALAALALLSGCNADRLPSVARASTPGLASAFANSEWSTPVHLDAPINSASRELGAQLSPDGLSLYFGSDRAGGAGGMDIWAARRECEDCPWGTPLNLNINSPKGDGSPSFTPDGHVMFFASNRDDGHGGDDIWVAYREDTNDDQGWGSPINLGSDVNTSDEETSPTYVPALHAEGVTLYFGRGAGASADLYKALVTPDGETKGPAEAVAELNAADAFDSEPAISHDGKEIFFWSTRSGGSGLADLWVATRRNAHDPWSTPVNLGTAINTRGADLTPGLSHDGRTLLWSAGANARSSLGFQDIWMSTRTPSGR